MLEESSNFESFNGSKKQKTMIPKNLRGNAISAKVGTPAATFTVKITRLTANIAGALPVCIFGPQKMQSQYVQFLTDSSRLPNTTTSYDGMYGGLNTNAVAPSIANATQKVFSFTDSAGPATDLISVETVENPYPEVLDGIARNPMVCNRIRMSLSDPTQESQFSQSIEVLESTLYGKTESQIFTPQDEKSPNQFQQGIVDILRFEFDVNSQTFFVVPIINVANFTLTMSFSVADYARPLA